jgi:hypothetical protein
LSLGNAPCRHENLAPVPINLFDFSRCNDCCGGIDRLEGSLEELQTIHVVPLLIAETLGCGRKNISPVLYHTRAADPEKVQSVIQNLEIGLQCDLFFHFIQAVQVRVDNFFTFDTDNVWMGVGLVAVIAVAPIREPQLQNLADRFKDNDVFVNSGEAGGRKVVFYLRMDIFDAGMAFTFGENFNDRQPLGRYLVTTIL